MDLNNLFSKDEINKGRQIELDIAKGFAIIFMILCHVALCSNNGNSALSPTYYFITDAILGGPCAAPVFMFCMGVGIVYSKHSQWNNLIKRGIKLFLLGIALNLFRNVVLYYVSGALFGNWNYSPIYGGLMILFVDIFAFAGLSFILLGILKKFNLSNKMIILITLLMSILGSFINSMNSGPVLINFILGNFIGTDVKCTAFPLFNWFIFPIGGYIWGQYFIRVKDKNKFFKYWPLFIIIPFIYFLFISKTFLYTEAGYYYFNTFDGIICLLYVHGIIGLCYYLSKYMPNTIIKSLKSLSYNITEIYFLQWIFIPYGILFLPYIFKNIVMTDLICFIYSLIIIIITAILCEFIRKLKKRKNNI